MNSVVFFGTSSRSKVLSCFRPSMGGGGAALMRELSCELKLGRTGSVGGLRMGGLGIASPASARPSQTNTMGTHDRAIGDPRAK